MYASVVIVLGSRHHSDVHTPNSINAVLVDLGEHCLFVEAKRVVAATVKLPRRQAAEVTDTWQRDREQSMFHEIDQDKIDRVRGFDITVVTTAKTDEEGRALLKALGFPFRTAENSGN